MVGFDDIPLDSSLTPGVDTVRLPVYEMGALGLEVLLAPIEAIGKTPVHRLLDLELIMRGSVEAPQSANRSFQVIA